MMILILCLIGLVLGVSIRVVAGRFGGVPIVKPWVKLGILLLSGAAIFAAHDTYLELEEYLARRSWPKTDAIILTSTVVGDRAYRPVIAFQYSVGESLFTDTTDLNTPGFGNKRRRLEVAEAWVKEYPPGKEVAIFYDPAHPQDAYISISPPWVDLFIPGLGVFLSLVLGFVVVCPTRTQLR